MGLNLFALAAAKLAFSHRYGMSLILPIATPYDTYILDPDSLRKYELSLEFLCTTFNLKYVYLRLLICERNF